MRGTTVIQVHAAKENMAALPGSARALSIARDGFNLLAFLIGHGLARPPGYGAGANAAAIQWKVAVK